MAISLDKRAEKVGIQLAKRGITQVPKVRVGAALDVSGSARGFYQNGVMQETLERLMGVALKFDDNGELDMWAFSDRFKDLPTANANNAARYLRENLDKAGSVLWGATEYGGVLQNMIETYFPKETKGMFGGLFGGGSKANSKLDPAMVLFVTDGSNSDRTAAARILREAVGKPVYFMMVGVGPESYFDFIKEMADELPNVGFLNLNSLDISDDDLYEQLVSGEFADWVKQFVK